MTPTTPAAISSLSDLFAVAQADPVARGHLLDSFRDFLTAVAREQEVSSRFPFGDSALVQDALVVAWEHFPAFRGTTPAELSRWLERILRRLAFHRARGAPRPAPDPLETLAPGDGALDLPDPRARPGDEAAAADEEEQTLRAAVESLPGDYRDALALRFRDGLTFDEIGRRLGRSPEAARKIVVRALQATGHRVGHLRDR